MSKLKIDRVQQVGMIVRDIDEKIENYKKIIDIDPAGIKLYDTRKLAFSDKKYLGKYVDFDLKIALFRVGGIQFELIQPLNASGDYYSDYLDEKGEGINHLCVMFEDNDAFLNVMKDMGKEPVNTGHICGADYFYYDLNDVLGFVIEGGKK